MDFRGLAFELLPEHIRAGCEKLKVDNIEEVRLRTGFSARLVSAGREYDTYSRPVKSEELNRILEIATNASLHSVSDSLKAGYVTYRGLRIGTCGTAVTKNGEIYAFSRYTSLNIRIPQPFRGNLEREAETICTDSTGVLIVSPPGGGKTTALRELVRLVSEKGYRVSAADDRGELFPSLDNSDFFERGSCTDVIYGADKETAALMLLRNMNPQFIALDEISRRQEINAVREIAGCGVNIMSTAHGRNWEDMKKRNAYRQLFEEGIFTHILEIGTAKGERKYTLKKLC